MVEKEDNKRKQAGKEDDFVEGCDVNDILRIFWPDMEWIYKPEYLYNSVLHILINT